MQQLETLPERIQSVRDRVHRACEMAHRDPADVTLLAVSKRHPEEALREAWACGLRQFGESYVQEWQNKRTALSDLEEQGLKWRIIGHLQRNKCKYIAGHVSLIHSVDSLNVANELERRTPEGHTQPILMQFNLGKEESKSGWEDVDDAIPVLEHPWEHIRIEGLMTLPPNTADPEAARVYFQQLAQLRDRLQEKTGVALPQLSMGMSHDLEVAIAEGSTCVRVGTAIFGPRPNPEIP